MLVLADRGFPSYELYTKAAATGAELAWRVSASFTLPVKGRLPARRSVPAGDASPAVCAGQASSESRPCARRVATGVLRAPKRLMLRSEASAA